MRRILVLVLGAVLLTGCDFFRSLAGRPTSADIERKRVALEMEKEEHRDIVESGAVQMQIAADSLAVIDSIRKASDITIRPGALDGLTASSLPCRFYIMIGAFSNRHNAESLSRNAAEAGYDTLLVDYFNGLTAVAVCPGDDLADTYASLKKLRTEAFCPPDVWVLENR